MTLIDVRYVGENLPTAITKIKSFNEFHFLIKNQNKKH